MRQMAETGMGNLSQISGYLSEPLLRMVGLLPKYRVRKELTAQHFVHVHKCLSNKGRLG